jgi:hypothetical protein
MKKVTILLALMGAAAVPLITYMVQRQQARRGRFEILRDAVSDRAEEAGETAREAFGALTGTAGKALGTLASGAQERAGSTAGSVLAGAPRVIAQVRGGDHRAVPYGGRDDWRRYGNIFPD